MERAIVPYQSKQIAERLESREMIETIKQTVCKGASDAQLKLFIEVCKATGLNPFLKGEIWYVPERGIIMAGRDGYLRVANENPNFDGMETRVERDEKHVPIKAVCTVWRKDRSHPIICEAYFNEYRKGGGVWSQYPSAMISKVAEVLALKRSFAINGVVSEEEIAQEPQITPQQLAEAKIEQLKAGVPYAEATAQQPDLVPVLEASIASIEQAKANPPAAFAATARRKLSPKLIDILQAFGALKKRYIAIGQRSAYYSVLGAHGVEHSDQFPDSALGVQSARAAYKEMSLDISDREADAAKPRPEITDDDLPPELREPEPAA